MYISTTLCCPRSEGFHLEVIKEHYSFNFKSKLIQQVPYKALVKQIITTTMSLVNFNTLLH